MHTDLVQYISCVIDMYTEDAYFYSTFRLKKIAQLAYRWVYTTKRKPSPVFLFRAYQQFNFLSEPVHQELKLCNGGIKIPNVGKWSETSVIRVPT